MEENKECICPRINCPRHGKCSECRAHHAAERKIMLPYCEKVKQKAEKNKQRELRRSLRKK